jgi:endoglucanase Acf2
VLFLIFPQRIHDLGRLLLSTEIRTAQTYWHVRSPGPNITRIYPEIYAGKVVGMLWSLLAEQQTWFGNAPYFSYGIQLMPITAISEQRDTPAWVKEMLPLFNESCAMSPTCESEGWSVLVITSQATIGEWKAAWKALNSLNSDVFDGAGGNGHSRSNTLWYIATRPA